MIEYDGLWKEERHMKSQPDRLPRRVKDWPEEAQEAFKDVKNQLWKWAKSTNLAYRGGLGLWAYEAVKEAWESPDESPEERRRRQVHEYFGDMKAFIDNPTNRTLRAANGERLE